MNTTPRRRWSQISVREVALVLVALGFGLAWYSEHREWAPVRSCIAEVRDGALTREISCDIDGGRVDVLVTAKGVVWVQDAGSPPRSDSGHPK